MKNSYLDLTKPWIFYHGHFLLRLPFDNYSNLSVYQLFHTQKTSIKLPHFLVLYKQNERHHLLTLSLSHTHCSFFFWRAKNTYLCFDSHLSPIFLPLIFHTDQFRSVSGCALEAVHAFMSNFSSFETFSLLILRGHH